MSMATTFPILTTTLLLIILRSTEGAVGGPQYGPFPSKQPVFRDLGHIEGRGGLLKCFLVLLSCTQLICFHKLHKLFEAKTSRQFGEQSNVVYILQRSLSKLRLTICIRLLLREYLNGEYYFRRSTSRAMTPQYAQPPIRPGRWQGG